LNNHIESIDPFILAAACVFLACKIDEDEKNIKECLSVFHNIKPHFVRDAKEMILLEQKIIDLEFDVLCNQDFDFSIDLAFSLLSEAKKLIIHKLIILFEFL